MERHRTGRKCVDQRLVDGNRAIAEHREQGRSLRVFRAHPPQATYLGEFELDPAEGMLRADAPDLDGNIRQVIVFRLRPAGEFIRGDLPDAPPLAEPGVIDIPAEDKTPVAADVPAEGNVVASFTVEPTADPVEYQRREAALVDRYKGWLTRQKHTYGRKRIQIPGEAGRLYTDLHDHELDELIEAKASAARVSIRSGLGQLLDYARYVPHEQKTLLLPSEPRADLLRLLHDYGCGCVWETELGRFKRRDPTGQWLGSRRRAADDGARRAD